MTDFQTGLLISAIGLTVTFTALGIFIGIIVLLKKIFPAKSAVNEAQDEEKTIEPAAVVIEAETGAEEIAAALAAVTYIRSQRAGQLGAALLTGPGPFRTSR